MKLVECVPNFSEGRDKKVIDAIAASIESVKGVALLDVDAGQATNRTVYTFAGSPEAALEAAFQAIKKGTELIDMRHHKGEHARQGACDVCPFIPIANMSMEECVELAKRLGKRVADELQIPVYLYAHAATNPKRVKLPDIRIGEYEALEDKLNKPEWKPDFGEAKFNAKSGVLVIGARNFLIAYNVNLNTKSVKLAKDIAFTIRESGKLARDKKGEKIIDKDGVAKRVAGLFKEVQATGWYISEYNRAQVTINILDIEKSPLHLVYDKCLVLAANSGLRVTGSEIVGMVSEKVLLDAGIYFLKKQGATTGVSKNEIIQNAIMSLGLTDVSAFNPDKKIIERRFLMPSHLASMTVKDFCEELGSNSPAPGGGSVAALSGALSAALSAMVAALTFEKKGFENLKPEMEELGVKAQKLLDEQVRAIDADTAAFNKVMDAFKLPKETDEQKKIRTATIQEANKGATLEPFRTLERTLSLLEISQVVAEKGNPNSLSDAGVAALSAKAAAYGAYYNVLINLKGIKDETWCKNIKSKSDKIISDVNKKADEIEKSIMKKLQ